MSSSPSASGSFGTQSGDEGSFGYGYGFEEEDDGMGCGDSEGGGMAPEGARDRDALSPASSDWWRAAATAAAEAARASESAAVPSPCGSSGEAEAAEAEKTEFPSGATTQHGTGMPVEGSRAGT